MDQMIIPKIDPKVFRQIRKVIEVDKKLDILKETPVLPVIINAKAPPSIEQGIELYYQNIPFPRKGFPDADILNALNIVKKDGISWLLILANKYLIPCYIVFGLLPWKWKIKIIDKFLQGFIRKANYWLDSWYYQPQYYCPFANEIKNVGRFFLWDLGINKVYVNELADIICMFPEHDDRWRVVMQDLCNEVNVEEMLKSPNKEIRRLSKLLFEREQYAFTIERMNSILIILGFVLYHPKIRKAFKNTVKLAHWDKLRFDDGDKYWGYKWSNYNIMGLSREEREQRMIKLHEGLGDILQYKVSYD